MLARDDELAGRPISGRFLRVARSHSLCEDDAWEALARGLEIALRHRRASAGAWFATVVKHEAVRLRRSRSRDVQLDPELYQLAARPEPELEREHDPRLPALRAPRPLRLRSPTARSV